MDYLIYIRYCDSIARNEDVAMFEGGGSIMDLALALAGLDYIGPSARAAERIYLVARYSR